LVASKVLTSLEVAANGLAICLGGVLTVTNLWWFVSNYGEHSYFCGGKPLPCLTYSKVDDPFAIVGLALLVSILCLLLITTALHVWKHRTPWLIALLSFAAAYWILLVIGLGIFVLGYLLSSLSLLVGCMAAVARQLLQRVEALTASPA
jgi:hypothetical protein